MAPGEHLQRSPRRCPRAGTAGAGPSSAGRRRGRREVITSPTTCSGRAVESTSMALRPPVSAIRGTSGRLSSSSRARAMRRALAVEPVKATPATRGIGDERLRRPPAPPGTRCSTSGGHAGLARQAHGGGGDQRRLRRGLGDHGVAGRQGGGDLAEEDGQREVPRADAGEDAAAGQAAARWSRRSGPGRLIGRACRRASTA